MTRMQAKDGSMGFDFTGTYTQVDEHKLIVCTINVDHLDDTMAKIEKSGGQMVVPKAPIPGMGRLAYFKDTEGNIVGLIENDKEAK